MIDALFANWVELAAAIWAFGKIIQAAFAALLILLVIILAIADGRRV